MFAIPPALRSIKKNELSNKRKALAFSIDPIPPRGIEPRFHG